MNRHLLFSLAITQFALFVGFAPAEVRFVNLSNQPIRVATSVNQTGKASPANPPGAKAGNLAEGTLFSGWTVISPGASQEFPAGQYHLTHNGIPISFNTQPSSKGLIKSKGDFRQFVSKANADQETKDLLKNGFKQVTYQKFDSGNFTYGNDFRLEVQTFKFNFTSSNQKTPHKAAYPVPGRVMYHEVNVKEQKTASFKWKQEENQVSVTGFTEGAVNPKNLRFKDKSFYNGSVTVHFIRQ